ncbi:RBBP5 [Bugula neritina]|uniref:RBBP5 n=1 Tax=Bugula neritina TaxID=10212 RepID=A0A7J7J6A0_BUGNE|nr:RBBP5 [Bugula neritina]
MNHCEAEVEDLDVDVTTCEKILAFVSSDEEDEDKGCLLYLPIAPEVEDPEDTLLNVSDPANTPEKRQLSPITEAPAPKKGKPVDVALAGAPTDEVHPLLSSRKPPNSDKSRAAARSKPKAKNR